MKKYRAVTVERLIIVCDRCGREIDPETDDYEWQERFIIRFTGGFGSEFGDGDQMEGDFCQHCIKQVIGKYLRKVDGSTRQADKTEAQEPARVYQDYQLRNIAEAESLFRAVRTVLAEKGEEERERRNEVLSAFAGCDGDSELPNAH
ncbi:hypothetical protein [Propionivibrio sp.]|uniref:hypothetical protein n=1 Tax=Propionivibrio sp. TaxID=2212460 RepID=UPI003BEFEF43